METICFKVAPAVAQELDKRAGEMPGASRNTAARQILLAALADERFQPHNETAVIKAQLPPDTICFKVDPAIVRELENRAGEKPGASCHTVAKQMLLEDLTDYERHQTRKDLAELRKEVEGTRRDLATAVVALLCRAGMVESATEAEAWVRRALLK